MRRWLPFPGRSMTPTASLGRQRVGKRVRAFGDMRAVRFGEPPAAGQRQLPIGKVANAWKIHCFVLECRIEIIRKVDEAGRDPLGVEGLEAADRDRFDRRVSVV